MATESTAERELRTARLRLETVKADLAALDAEQRGIDVVDADGAKRLEPLLAKRAVLEVLARELPGRIAELDARVGAEHAAALARERELIQERMNARAKRILKLATELAGLCAEHRADASEMVSKGGDATRVPEPRWVNVMGARIAEAMRRVAADDPEALGLPAAPTAEERKRQARQAEMEAWLARQVARSEAWKKRLPREVSEETEWLARQIDEKRAELEAVRG